MLVIQFFHRQAKLKGGFGKLKSLSVDRRGIERFPATKDRELLRLLLAHDIADQREYRGYGSYYGAYGYEQKLSEVSLAGAAYRR